MQKAIDYILDNRKGLTHFTEDPRLPIDNNAAERAIRRVAIGRKNWLFLGSETGGRTAAILMSLLGTCWANRVNAWAYLKDVLDRMPSTPEDQLEQLLSGSISYESVIDLPAVGIAGAPNAGKSSLLNKLLGKERSIVSHRYKTTRDILTGVCNLPHCRCVLFDCAGLLMQTEDILDELAQQAAIEAFHNSNMVLFCVDISKNDWKEDAVIRDLIETKLLVPVATKCDLLSERILPESHAALNKSFEIDFLPTSTQSGSGIESLRQIINSKLTENIDVSQTGGIALTARHRKAVTEAIDHVSESVGELKADNDEVAAMMLRTAYQAVSNIEQPATAHIDEQILGQIFSRFCIGK
jgi:tRNA modification GTPase